MSPDRPTTPAAPLPLHGPDAPVGGLRALALAAIDDRLAGPPFGAGGSPDELARALAGAVTPGGIGIEAAWRLFDEVVAPSTYALDGPRFLAFVPMAPAVAAVWMDAVVGASSFSAESWLEAAGAVAAEEQALAWLAGLAGLPPGSGGAFCSGGSLGNLSALAVARDAARGRRTCAVADTAHASVANALHLLGLVPLVVPTGSDGRFTGALLRAALDEHDGAAAADLAAVVASAGSTNGGVVDDLAGLADVAHGLGAWLHVDAAYGGAALLLPERRSCFAGIGAADSLIVDPHKWLFATAGSCALLYRDPAAAARTHTQHGPYIDALHGEVGAWNPSDLAFQLTRRAAGLPFWFTLVAHGADALAAAVRVGVDLAVHAADVLAREPEVEVLLEPELSVVLFRRDGWDRAAWAAWATDLRARRIAFVAPTTWKGEPVGRLVFLHPSTTTAIVDEVVATLR